MIISDKMYEVGKVLNIENKKCCICNHIVLDEKDYLNIAFDGDKNDFKIYSAKIQDESIILEEIKSKKLLTKLSALFVFERILED